MALQPFVGPWPLFFSSVILYIFRRTPPTRDQQVARPLPTYRTTQTQNKSTQLSMPGFRFGLTTQASEHAKMVHALDRAAGRAIAQVVSRWLLTAAARVRTQDQSCGFCDGQSGSGVGFLRVLWYPLPILIPPTAPHSSSSIIRGWYSRQNCERRTKWIHLTPPQETNKKIKKTWLRVQYDRPQSIVLPNISGGKLQSPEGRVQPSSETSYVLNRPVPQIMRSILYKIVKEKALSKL
jgi:hypothetical protein